MPGIFQCLLLVFQTAAAVQVQLHAPSLSGRSGTRLSKQPSKSNERAYSCFSIIINVGGVDIKSMVDSTSSDSVVPFSNLNNYNGPNISYTPFEEPSIEGYSRDVSWKGYGFSTDVFIPETGIPAVDAPIVGIFKQATEPALLDGQGRQAVFGLAYPSLAYYHTTPATIMDAWYEGRFIPNNEVGVELCPYKLSKKSHIDIGSTEVVPKCGTDGNPIAWVESPTNDRFTVSIKEILVNSMPVELPDDFQKKREGESISYSYIDTCATKVEFPYEVVDKLISAIVKSHAFVPKLDTPSISKFFWSGYPMTKSDFIIIWSRLPTLSIVMNANNPEKAEGSQSTVKVTLGPRDYMQQVGENAHAFSVSVGSDKLVVLGVPFMTRLRVVLDRAHKRIGFGPGCGCEKSKDGHPTIQNEFNKIWHPKQKTSKCKLSRRVNALFSKPK
ncbi:hypothetical protein QVD99_005825 [Batrachochytrium dendrobatidis]|nr:hypothetical protein O5D80_000695 [Batrachochytrium dendrobatidis]KAK5667717.1 hypothetical protein QVD99_005825 [Batrachochytrium dendrobatidis]